MGPKEKDELSPEFWDKADKIIDGIINDMADEIDSTYDDEDKSE